MSECKKIIVNGFKGCERIEQEILIDISKTSDVPGKSVVEVLVARLKKIWKKQGITFDTYELRSTSVQGEPTEIDTLYKQYDLAAEVTESMTGITVKDNVWVF